MKEKVERKVVPLYITNSINALEALALKDETIKNLKKVHRYPNIVNKMKGELFLSQDDQEKCYILCRRYLNLLDYLFRTSDDANYTRALFGNDYNKVQELFTNLRNDLERRYKTRSEQIPGQAASSTAETTDSLLSIDKVQITEEASPATPVFLGPNKFFDKMMQGCNMLIIDIRTPEEFQGSRISLLQGDLINIPEDMILPGLSANTLGLNLPDDLKVIWDKRDLYELIVLMDYDTQSHNYSGSKLERLRSFIVDWDFNKAYAHLPVVLEGGLREFAEWYPSEVNNAQIFLSQTNSEIDELLDLESVEYPETGGIRMNLKVHSVTSLGDLETRIQRDFGDVNEGRIPARPSRSEGELPKDAFISRDTSLADVLKSSSTSALIEQEKTSDLDIKTDNEPAKKEESSSSPDEDTNVIRNLLEGDRLALLLKARAAKPVKLGDTAKLFEKPEKLGPPVVDRSFKPAKVVQPPPLPTKIGEGFTGLQNVKNSCYMNCILQCMKALPLFKSVYVTSNLYISYTKKFPPAINMHLANVLRTIWEGTEKKPKLYYPHSFKQKIVDLAPMYDKGTHEDTFEFFMFLFNVISEDCAVDLPRPVIMTDSEKAWYAHLQGRTSWLVDTFYYQLKNTKICWQCRKPNYSFETDSSLMLPIPNSPTTLKKLVAEYLKENLIGEYSCSDCKSTATIVNVKEIIVDPEILVIVLKRYIVTSEGGLRKNEVEIDFPLENLKFGKSYYRLYGIAHHSGSMTHGHYFASVLLDDASDKWVLFNDEKVTTYDCKITNAFGMRTSCSGFFYVRTGPI